MVGTEILRDGRTDTNGPWIGETLARRGFRPAARRIVGDDREEIAAAIRQSAERADLVVISGGLGPTFDDLTREGAALALGRSLLRDPEQEAALRERYARRGLSMPEAVARMADRLEGAEILVNRVGAAPGQFLAGPPVLAMVPGVPSEMEAMVRDELLPRLEGPEGGEPEGRLVLKIAGLYESEVQGRIEPLREVLRGLETTILASPGEVTLILRGGDEPSMERTARELRGALGDAIFSERDEGIEWAAGRALARSGLSLAVAESCTGGMLASMITRVPGSSRYFLGGAIAYADDAKEILARVPGRILRAEGAVSAGVASALARGIRRRLGTDVALALTGIAGPEGGTPEKPVGLVFLGLAAPWGETVRRLGLAGGREGIRLRACRAALDLLRREMMRAGRWDSS